MLHDGVIVTSTGCGLTLGNPLLCNNFGQAVNTAWYCRKTWCFAAGKNATDEESQRPCITDSVFTHLWQ